MSEQVLATEYRCPGETYTITRAVHLARLSGYYAACRDCSRRDDTAGLSARQVRRVAEAMSLLRDKASPRGANGFRNVAINDMSPAAARAIAVEFARGTHCSRHTPRAVRPKLQASELHLTQCDSSRSRSEEACYPSIVFAGDGRLSTAAVVAAIVEGIRWTGCEAIDLGAASVPCTERAIEKLAAGGGIYLGNPSGAAHTLGMKFWVSGKRVKLPQTSDGADVKANLLDRPSRQFGPLRRVDGAEGYLNELRPAYHALRPLKFVLRSSCEPVVTYLNELLQNVACRVISADSTGDLGEQVVAANSHFGIEITDDGEDYRFFDEQGKLVASKSLTQLFTSAAGDAPQGDALRTLTYLLVLLSRDDSAFSAVLDRSNVTR